MNDTIDTVSEEIRAWRSRKKTAREAMPDVLVKKVRSLLSHHSKGELVRRLNVSYALLSEQKVNSGGARWVSIPRVTSCNSRLEVSLPNGIRLSIEI